MLALALVLTCLVCLAEAIGKAAVMGANCSQSEFARMGCRAVERSKVRYPLDSITYIPMSIADCHNWMIAKADEYRSVTMVGPQLMPCLVANYRAHPSTHFFTIDFCPPSVRASNVICGQFRTQLPSLTAGFPGYMPGYPTGVASEAKVELICSIVDKELARIRTL